MNKSRIFVLICLGFCAGILLGSRFYIDQPYVYIAAAVFVCFILALARGSRSKFVALFLFFTCLGVLRIQFAYSASQLAHWFETQQSVEGVIVKDVDVRENIQMLTVRPEGHGQNILVTTAKSGQFFYGDKVWLTGEVTAPENFSEFDYIGYLERQNVYAVMRYPKVIVLKTQMGNPVLYRLMQVKYWFVGQVNQVLPEPHSSLLLGILIGARKSLPSEVVENFNTTGVSHIVALSGYNISVLVSALGFLVYYFGRRTGFWVTGTIIFLFVLISGASASVVRAGLMGALLLFAARIGRLYAITPALCFAATCMLVVNPKILYWDAGFQLSFLATIGIVYGMPVLQALTLSWPKVRGLKMIFLATMSAIIATLPLILLLFGRLSLVAPLVNLLIIPAVPPAMFFGFFSAAPFFGPGFALIAHGLLEYMLIITAFFAQLKFAAAEFHLSLWQFYGLYAIVLAAWYLLKRYAKPRQRDFVDNSFSLW